MNEYNSNNRFICYSFTTYKLELFNNTINNINIRI